jgi:hypothetical protein
MGKPWKTIVGFALLGLAIAGACYAYGALHDYAKPMTGREAALVLVSVILCPPQLLFAACLDCEVIGWGGLIMYSIVGVLNAALYSAIGALVVELRKTKSN